MTGLGPQVLLTQFTNTYHKAAREETPVAGDFGQVVCSQWPPILEERAGRSSKAAVVSDSLLQAFTDTDALLGNKYHSSNKSKGARSDPGSTASCLLITDDHFVRTTQACDATPCHDTALEEEADVTERDVGKVFANLGDSRAILCSDGKIGFAYVQLDCSTHTFSVAFVPCFGRLPPFFFRPLFNVRKFGSMGRTKDHKPPNRIERDRIYNAGVMYHSCI